MKDTDTVLAVSKQLKEAGISCIVSPQSPLVLITKAANTAQVMKAEAICNPVPEPEAEPEKGNEELGEDVEEKDSGTEDSVPLTED
jgi:hypothetical protein